MKNIMKLAIFGTVFSLQAFGANSCDIRENTNFLASYSLSTLQGKSNLNYYRTKDQAAFEYLNQGITEVWTQTKNDKAYLVRGFDKDKRSIEYDVIDLSMENENSSWEKRKNMMNPDRFDFDRTWVENSKGCSLTHYSKSTEHSSSEMIWDKNKELLVSLEVKNDNKIKYAYTLTKLQTLTSKNNHLAQVLAYDRTDFADIGDNESDPFFRKMINLGFIAHHETNIIDSNGHQLSLASSHKH